MVSKNGLVKIIPFRVYGFDQQNLSLSGTAFDLLLALYSCVHVFMQFKPYKEIAVVFVGEGVRRHIFVLKNAFRQIGCDTGVQRAIFGAGHDVGTWLFWVHGVLWIGWSCNDGVDGESGFGFESGWVECPFWCFSKGLELMGM
jgi:hypothetical protein